MSRTSTWLLIALLLCRGLVGCAPEPSNRSGEGQSEPVAPAVSEEPAGDEPLVAFIGDSLTAGHGLPLDQAFPALLQQQLRREGTPIRVLNAGVSGDTSAGGLRRLPWILAQRPDVVVVGLGGNDGLRGLDPAQTEGNLRALVLGAREAGARVLLLGMRMPPSMGIDYVRAFEDVYPRVARELDVPLVPFMLEGVGGRPEMNQDDGIHPNAGGQARVAATVLHHLRPLVTG